MVSEPTPADLPAIDRELTLQKTNGNQELATEILKMLVDSLPQDIAAIEEAHQAGERDTLRQQVHKLHGGASFCGVPALAAAAKALELLLVENPEQPYDSAFQCLIEQAARLNQTYQCD